MIFNIILNKIQRIFEPIYENSFFLKKIDLFIEINIFLVIFSSTIANSDQIGYFAIIAILLTFIKLATKTGEKFEMNLADKFLLIYFLFVIISVAGSTLFFFSLKGFLKTATYLGFYISVFHYLKDNKDKIQWIFIAFALCACYETFFAFLQNIGAVEEISGWQDVTHLNPEEVMTRVYGTLKPYNPNLFGGYMLSIIPSFIALPFLKIFQSNKTNNNIKFRCAIKYSIPLIFYLLSVTALVLTGCRGAYIGFFFQTILLICIIYKLLKPNLKKIFSIITSFCMLIVSFLILTTASLKARILSIFAMRSDSSNSFRFNVYHSCINMFKDNWLLGIGCGNQNFREVYGLYMRTGFDALSAYNIYLEIAVESGIFALITFFTFLICNFYKALKFVIKNKIEESVFILSAILSIIGILTHGFVDTVFFRPQIQFTFWIMIAIIRASI